MDMTSWLRRKVFWLCDSLFLGGEYKSFYQETAEAYEKGERWSVTRERLERLLEHAANTTQFYTSYKGVTDLERFPIVNKTDYQKRWDDFVSSKYAHDPKCHRECTSGSTGTPLEILYDQRKSHKRQGSSIFLNALADYRIGDRQMYMRIWVERVQPSFIKKAAMNLIPWDTTNLDQASLHAVCDALEKRKVTSIAGYASSLAAVSQYIQKEHIDCSHFKVKSITPVSEALCPGMREQLAKQFSCPVCALYGSEEFGTVGVQRKDTDEYYVDSSGAYFEVLKLDEDVPAEDGELGRLVITDLYNYAFPLIRYDNGDTVIRRTEALSDGRYRQYFTQIYGRRSDLIYGTDGNPRSPFLITNKMWGIEHIAQWKFVQTGKTTYQFILNGDKAKIDEGYIQSLFQDDLGAGAMISFKYVDEIPVLRSGKRKYIENQFRGRQTDDRRNCNQAR